MNSGAGYSFAGSREKRYYGTALEGRSRSILHESFPMPAGAAIAQEAARNAGQEKAQLPRLRALPPAEQNAQQAVGYLLGVVPEAVVGTPFYPAAANPGRWEIH